MSPDLTRLDAVALAALCRQGEVTAESLQAASRERLHRLDPAINAVIEEVEPGPLAMDGPLAGVPFLLKDAFATLAGTPTRNGTRLMAEPRHTQDSVLVQRLKRAGLAILGKTNCPELNSLGTTEPRDFGPTRNPWNLGRSAGGSSGGSAAAVAARIVPAAHGSDGAGSIRIPASCCGIVGLKPSRGRITLAPLLGESINGGMTEGALTLSVRDSAVLLDLMQGSAPGDPYLAPSPREPYASALDPARRRRLRIAVTRGSLIETALHADCIAAVDSAARLCAALGHSVEEAAPPIDGATYNRLYRRVWPVNVARSVARLERRLGEGRVAEKLEPFNQHLCEIGRSVGAVELVLTMEWMQATARAVTGWLDAQGFDLWLMPTLGLPPTPLGFFDAGLHGGATAYDRFIQQVAFTTFANMFGQPAISLPLHWSGDGLPVGCQFQARYDGEALLLSLAAELEEAQPWMQRRPPLIDAPDPPETAR